MDQKPRDPFHAHLDVCRRCESQPFNLCPVGAKLIGEVVLDGTLTTIGDLMKPTPGDRRGQS